ncbi:MAG: hypothetical protein DRN96_01815 [Thermoproteota archaeon]|nr:MAG: hypothetical protein DRN96_01815 [Candidatus Korarchaeota archaeon]RLG55474.1 MAG: hypothetical protein DRN99_02545 [Candidatus Korarchaeota archaeon]
MLDSIKHLVEVLSELSCEFKKVESERLAQDLIAFRLRIRGLDVKRRVRLESQKYPDVEVDILLPDVALEIKVGKRFYDGFGQALAVRELYGLNSCIVHLVEQADEKHASGLRALASKLGIKAILMSLRDCRVEVVG